MAVALIVFGPKKLPEIGKSLGKALREFQRAKADLLDSVTSVTDEVRDYARVDLDDEDERPARPRARTQTLDYPGLPPASEREESRTESPLPYGGDFDDDLGEPDISARAGAVAAPAAVAVRAELAGKAAPTAAESSPASAETAAHPGNGAISAGR